MLGELTAGMTPAGEWHLAVLVLGCLVALTVPHLLADWRDRHR